MSEKIVKDIYKDEKQQLTQDIKSHKEIISLLDEIEEIEQEIEQSFSTFPSLLEPTESTTVLGEIADYPIFQEVELPKQETESNDAKKQRFFQKKGLLSREPKKPQDKIQFKKRLHHFFTGSEEPLSTFTLTLDAQGQLLGFNIKEPSPAFKQIFTGFLQRFKQKRSESSDDSSKKRNVFSGIIQKIKRNKKSEKEDKSSSRFSGIVSKILKIKKVIPGLRKKE